MGMSDAEFAQPKSFEEALELVNSSPNLRKVKAYIDNTDLSADMKAVLYDIAKVTVKVGETTIAIGRRIFDIAKWMVTKFPNLTIGTLVGVVVAAVIASTLGTIAPLAGLAALLSKLAVLLGVGKGFIDDLRSNVAKEQMDRVAAQFDVLRAGLSRS